MIIDFKTSVHCYLFADERCKLHPAMASIVSLKRSYKTRLNKKVFNTDWATLRNLSKFSDRLYKIKANVTRFRRLARLQCQTRAIVTRNTVLTGRQKLQKLTM